MSYISGYLRYNSLLSYRFESYPKGPGKHGESAHVRLGSWGIYGLWLSAQRRDSCSAQWSGRGEGHIQVFKHENGLLLTILVFWKLVGNVDLI